MMAASLNIVHSGSSCGRGGQEIRVLEEVIFRWVAASREESAALGPGAKP